ncbi:serine/threonine protein kinase, partial [Mycobacterium sp. ITM-2017-0098]
FTGDTALAVAYQRMDRDVAPPSTVIEGVPRQFDDLVACATSRDPQQRFADAAEMAEQLDVIARELDLPYFRVPAPQNSALHNSAAMPTEHGIHGTTANLSRPASAAPASPHTKAFARDELPVTTDDDSDEFEDDYRSDTGRFAGIELTEFYWARQRARRVLFFWVIAVITLAGLAAAGAWTLGANLPNLI